MFLATAQMRPIRCTYPFIWTQRVIGTEKLLAGCEILSSSIDALVVIDVILPAVLGLVCVWKPSIKTSRAQSKRSRFARV